MPKIDWNTSSCPVCGNSYDWLSKKPKTCSQMECIYKYQHKIDVHLWAKAPRKLKKLAEREDENNNKRRVGKKKRRSQT